MPPQDPNTPALDFSNIQGHQQHDVPAPATIGAPKPAPTQPSDEYDLGGQDVLDALGYIRDKIENYTQSGREAHPVLSRLGDITREAHEFLSGGQAAGKPLGTRAGALDEAQALSGAADAPELAESAANVASKGISHLAETGKTFARAGAEGLGRAAEAMAPEVTAEAGKIPLGGKKNFDTIAGHQTVEAPKSPHEPLPADQYVYHATDKSRADSIRQAGLKPNSWYANSADEAMRSGAVPVSGNRADLRVFAVPRSEIQPVTPDVADIGAREVEKGRFVQSGATHKPIEVDHEGRPFEPIAAESAEWKPEAKPQSVSEQTHPPNPQIAESAQRYNTAHGHAPIDHTPTTLPPAEERAKFADQYDAAKHEPENPAVQRSYEAMKKETLDQFNHLKNDAGISFDFTDKDPYPNAETMMRDVRENHHLSVYTGGDLPKDHPLAETEPSTGQSYNNIFRGVHDVLGHAAAGHDFSEAGEASAFKAHNQMYSPEAQPAVRTETMGQSNWFSNNAAVRAGEAPGKFAEQKATILPETAATPQESAEKAGAKMDLSPVEHEPIDEGSIKDTVETAGGVYKGINNKQGAPGTRVVEITLPREMTDKLPNLSENMKDHVSVSLPENEVSEENVRAALDRKYKEFGGKSEIEQLKEVYPTTTDPSSALRGGSFITPEGDYMPLGAGDEHFKAIEKVRPPDASAPRNKQVMQSREKLPDFLENNNLIRTRFLQGRAGRDLHVSVPENITPEQIQSIRQAVGKNRNGNLILETTKPGLENSKIYQFASPADVDKALHDLGVHPEGWSNKATKVMQEQNAGAIDPRTGKIDSTGFGVEIFPEARADREPLDHVPTKTDMEGFYNDHKELFDKHPELRIGWDKTDKGWELNIGAASTNPAGAEVVGRNLDQRSAWDIANKQEIPTGGKGEKTKFGQYPLEDRLADLSGKNVSKLPPTIKNSPHLTDTEKYLLGSDEGALKGFKSTRKKIASVQELAETAKAGEANRFWYDRARAAFGTMFDVLPKGSFPEADRDKFIGLVAATSPRADVTENLAASLNAYRAWVEEGRPTDPMRVREAVDSSLMMPASHGPNAARALTGQELSGPKVTSFLKNFMGSRQHVTNDMWGALTNGIMDAKELSNPGSYIALSENYRKAAASLGWTPQQAQAASWGFVRTLGNMAGYGGKQAGAEKPAAAIINMIDDPTVRKFSADIADIFLTSAKVRDRLESLGINLEEFDGKLRTAIEPYGRGGEGQTRGTNPKLLARTAEKVEQGKQYAKAQVAAGKRVNERAMPLLEGTLGEEPRTKKPRKR